MSFYQVVEMNQRAVDETVENMVKIEIPKEWSKITLSEADPGNFPEFVRKIMQPVLKMEGDKLPVSAFEPGGYQPTGTTVTAGRQGTREGCSDEMVLCRCTRSEGWHQRSLSGKRTNAHNATTAPSSVHTLSSDPSCWTDRRANQLPRDFSTEKLKVRWAIYFNHISIRPYKYSTPQPKIGAY